MASASRKVCSKCQVERPIEEFYARGGGRSGTTSHCKRCFHDWYKARYIPKGPPDPRPCQGCGVTFQPKTQVRLYCTDPCGKRFRRKETLLKRLKEQDGECAICKTKEAKVWTLDHDHSCCAGTSEQVCGNCYRGVLCSLCNSAIGFLRDNPALALAAADYLTKHKEGF